MAAFDGEYVFDAALTQALKDDIQRRTQEQLTEMLGVEVDTVMAEYVVVMIGNKKSMAQIAHDLVDFIGDEHANQFVVWLSGMLPTLEGGSASRDLPAATEDDAEALAPPSDGTNNEPQPQESKEPAKRIISLKSVTSSTAPTEQKKVVSLSGGSGTIRTLNRSGQDMQDVLARRSQRFGVTMTPANQQREKNQKDKAKDNGDGRGTKRKADGGDAQQKRPGSGRNVSQLLGPPVNVDQAELDARDSLNSNKRKKTGRGDDRDSRGNNRNDQENQKDSDGNSRRQNRRRQDNDMDGDQPPLPPSPSGDCDRQGRSDRPGRGDRDGREPRGQYPGNFRGPPGYGGYPPPPFGYPPLHYPPYGMPPYGMGFPPHGMHQGPYMQPPMPPGPPRGYQPRGARPFQNKKWVNPNAAKPEGEAGATTGEGATAGEPADGNSNPADGTPALNAGAPAYIPRNPYFSSQMRPRFQNKTWVRQDPAKEEELSSSLPQTPPREEMEAPPQ